MVSVPFLFVNLAALCCYIILFVAFLGTRKTAESRGFMLILAVFALWTGGSILMRLQIFPGIAFWFYVSILALFSSIPALYHFMFNFTSSADKKLHTVLTAGSVILMIATATGVFVEPPTQQAFPGGKIAYVYQLKWPVLIPVLYLSAMVFVIIRMLLSQNKQSHKLLGLTTLFSGLFAVAIGNLVQLIPGNTFPTDTLGGIILAFCITAVLIKRQMFCMELLLAPGVLSFVSTVILTITFLVFIPQVYGTISSFTRTDSHAAVLLTTTMAILVSWCGYAMFSRLFIALFPREERRKTVLNTYSRLVSQTLNLDEVIGHFVDVINREVRVSPLCVFLKKDDQFEEVYYNKGYTDLPKITFSQDNAIAARIQAGDTSFYIDSFPDDYGHTFRKHEEAYLNAVGADLVFALKTGSEAIGFILFPVKRRLLRYTNAETDFMDTVCHITSIAVRNATLYDRIYRESRIDQLTGLFSYNYFIALVNSMIRTQPTRDLALVYLDIDDMKLFNQLYGTQMGDTFLIRVAAVIREVVGSRGKAFRHSGKVFALLLHDCAEAEANQLANEIQRRVAEISKAQDTKAITISGGICVYPEAASTAQALMECADIAVFNAKSSGKGTVEIFRPSAPESHKVNERVMRIINQSAGPGAGNFSNYFATVLALTAAIDAKDHYTYNHSQNVAYYASTLALAAGLTDVQVKLVYEAALLHDIGKISIPEHILSKTGPLTSEERSVMCTHVNNSIEIVRHLPSMDYVIPVIIDHHERWDGNGYPRGVSGEAIPLSARCLAIADTFDAITSDRPYRSHCPLKFALSELAAGSGKQFDPDLVPLFINLIDEGDIRLPNQ